MSNNQHYATPDVITGPGIHGRGKCETCSGYTEIVGQGFAADRSVRGYLLCSCQEWDFRTDAQKLAAAITERDEAIADRDAGRECEDRMAAEVTQLADQLVDRWHSIDRECWDPGPIHEWMGWTWEQYAAWVESGQMAAPAVRVELDTEEPFAGQLDELFAKNATVHIERMDDGHLWMRVNDHVVNVSAVKRGMLAIHCEDDS